jgi:hypothetical protein
MKTLFTKKVSLSIVAIGFLLVSWLYIGYVNQSKWSTLSKFTQTTVTHQNAASLWQPSAENPYQTKLGSTASKVDALVVMILRKGTTLSSTGFATFISNLNTALNEIGKKPAYASNIEVQDILGYISYELQDTSKMLAATQGVSYQTIVAQVAPVTQTAPITTTVPQRETRNQVVAPATNTCTGNVPSGLGVTTQGYAISTPGPVTVGTVWTFKGDTQQYGCTWECTTGYERDGANGCKARAAGSGNKIKIVNPANNSTGVAGVKIDVIHNLLNATAVVGSYTTDNNGETPEFFIPEHIQQNFIIYGLTKDGMKITGASGCQSRVTQWFNFCDSPSSKTIQITMGSNQEVPLSQNTTLSLQDSSLSYGSIVGFMSTIIKGGEAGLLACTTPASNAAACDNPTTVLANQPGWSYDASTKTHTVNLDISGDGWPHQEYRTCLRNPGQSVQCFNLTPRVTTMSQDIRFSSSNGSTLSSIGGAITHAWKNLLACTQLASSGECNPTTVLANQPGWTYNNGIYAVNLNVEGQGWPKASYISCYKASGEEKRCFTTNPN